RGEEWIATFPIHWHLYDLFGWPKPVFAHLPVILGEDGKKLSKRHGAVTTAELRDAGFLPEAILNSLCLVGWSHPEGKELFDVADFVEHFSLERVHASSGILSFPKMLKFNHEHIKALEPPEFLGCMKKILGANIPDFSTQYVKIIQERCHTLNDLKSLFCFLLPETTYELTQIHGLEVDKVLKVVEKFRQALNSFDRESLNKSIEEISKEVDWKKSEVFKVIRIATLKRLETPPLIDTILEFGKEWTAARLEEFEFFFSKGVQSENK
ncbi:MAG: glutamate--tRNA ligase family protein, partial [Deltaproteobacteria bacterium]|nr:glutamate--tRNA ligase family protein [Deltaproteobacteria bacterium]